MIIKCCDLWNPEDCNEILEVEGTAYVNNESAPAQKANNFELTVICDPLNPMLHECFFSTKAKKVVLVWPLHIPVMAKTYTCDLCN